MKIVTAPGTSLLDAKRAFGLELEQRNVALPRDPVELRAKRAVPMAGDVLDVLEELASRDAREELAVGEEPVLPAVLLPTPHRACGGRNRDLDSGNLLDELADQRPLAGARRARDDEHRGHPTRLH